MIKRSLPDGTVYEVGWDGVPLNTRPYLAFDTETEVVDLTRQVPRLACLQVSNGERHVIVAPHDVPAFVMAHKGARWVGHNVAFDWPVVFKKISNEAFRPPGNQHWGQAGYEWLDALDENRINDTMLLDFLARLADPLGNPTHLRGLGELAKHYLGRNDVDKESTYRKRFGGLIGADWARVDPGFWEYAVKDVIVTWHVRWRIACLLPPAMPAWGTHGKLSECLQVRAAVVLGEVGRNGFAVDMPRVGEVAARLKAGIDAKAAEMEAQAPGVFRRYKVKTKTASAGDLMTHATTGVPKVDMVVLRERLRRVADEVHIDPDTMPKTKKTRELTTAQEPWVRAAGSHPFVTTWAALNDECKLHQFLVQLKAPPKPAKDSPEVVPVQDGEVHASYRTLVRTGRTSCTRPNVQQMPREPWLRELFVARPGKRLVIVDYSAIELVTLGAVLEDRWPGHSELAKQLRAGRDPHAYTAALVQDVDYEAFLSWKKDRPDEFKRLRQAAKAINFGVPGGLGATKLADYARANYQVDLSPDEAKELRQKLITVVYPELSWYLEDDLEGRLAKNLGKPREEVRAAFERHLGKEMYPWFWWMLDRIVGGQPTRQVITERGPEDHLLSGQVRDAVWNGLADLTKGTKHHGDCRARRGSINLWRVLAGGEAVTRTGRVRKALLYTEARNTPFQGLAADGAKVALYRLWRAGFDIVAFVHDEIVCEVPEASAQADQEAIEQIMIASMASVLGTDIPVKVEGKVSEKWVK